MHEVWINVAGLAHPIKPAGVVLIDRATGEPIPTSALGGVTLAELLGAVLPVAPNVSRGGGALDANTQRVTLATDGPGVASLSSIDNKTPAMVGGATPVVATARVCLGTFRVSVTTASQTLAQLINTSIPAGAVTCEIQPDGGTIRIRRDAQAPTTTLGLRVDDGVEKLIDTPLADVRTISGGASNVPANVIFFDRV